MIVIEKIYTVQRYKKKDWDEDYEWYENNEPESYRLRVVVMGSTNKFRKNSFGVIYSVTVEKQQ
jgi:hypothetical protein